MEPPKSNSELETLLNKPIEVITDRKPLKAILKKPLSAAPPRLQRLMLRLQKYDLNVRHKPEKEVPVADTLSRLHLKDTDDTHEAFYAQVHTVMTNLPISDTKISELQARTRDDPALQQLIRIIQVGWPNQRSQCPKSVLPYWNYRDELTVIDGLVLKGERIVIPTAARRKNAETESMWTYGNSEVQEPSKGSDVLAKHAQSDRKHGLELSNLPTVPPIQSKRTHDII